MITVTTSEKPDQQTALEEHFEKSLWGIFTRNSGDEVVMVTTFARNASRFYFTWMKVDNKYLVGTSSQMAQDSVKAAAGWLIRNKWKLVEAEIVIK